MSRSTSPVVAGPVGRALRIVTGLLVLLGVIRFWASGGTGFLVRTMAVLLGLVLVYAACHRLLRIWRPRLGFWFGSVVALIPLAIVFVLGIGGGPIFGHGEGQLAALSFLGISLVLAGARGDPGCEVLSIPNLLSSSRSDLACLLFTPLDRIERTLRNR